MAFPKAKTKRFNEVLSCAPPPGYYNPKMESSKLPGAYIEKQERFKSLLKDSPCRSISSNRSTSRNSSRHQGGLLYKEKSLRQQKFDKERNLKSEIKEWKQKADKQEQELFETKAELAGLVEELDELRVGDSPEEIFHIKQIKRCPDTDSEATLTADEGEEGLTPGLKYFDYQPNKSAGFCEEFQSKNVSLSLVPVKQEKVLVHDRRKKKRMCTKARKAVTEGGCQKPEVISTIPSMPDMNIRGNEKTNVLSNSSIRLHIKTELDGLQYEFISTDGERSCLKSFIDWLTLFNKKKDKCDAIFMDHLVTILPSFPDTLDEKQLIVCLDLYEELRNIRNNICCELEEHLESKRLAQGIYDKIYRLYNSEVEVYRKFKKAVNDRVAHLELQRKNDISQISSVYEVALHGIYESFSHMQEAAVGSTKEVIETLTVLLNCKKKMYELNKARKEEKCSRKALASENRKLLREKKKLLSEVNELREKLDALSAPDSEINVTLINSNKQIFELNSECEELCAQVASLKERNASLEDRIRQMDSEKVEAAQFRQKCNSVEKLEASLDAERDKSMTWAQLNERLSADASYLKSQIKDMDAEKASLLRCIDQFKVDNRNLKSQLESHTRLSADVSALESQIKDMDAEKASLLRCIDQFKVDNQNLKSQLESHAESLRKRAQDDLKLADERRFQELHAGKLIFLEAKPNEVEVRDDLNEELKKSEAAKEKWKELFLNLESKVSPFKDQLDAYEKEKNLLLCQNDQKQHELESLGEKYAQLLGHQNHKQKIKHVENIKNENRELKKQLQILQEKVLKQESAIYKFKSGNPILVLRDPRHQNILKENKPNTPGS